MGYTTEFFGEFKLNKKLDDETYKLLKGLSTTRRMKRRVDPRFGVEGEFCIEPLPMDDKGREDEATVIDYNVPPADQPGLWCDWAPTEDRKHIAWNGQEKFYYYVEWMEYLIKKILAPRGYIVSGKVDYQGENEDDHGSVEIKDNKVKLV